MKSFTFGIAWNWEFDAEFIAGLIRECDAAGVSSFQITPENLHETLRKIRSTELSLHAFYDRASDADEAFVPLVRMMRHPDLRIINPHQHVNRAIDKATMHLDFLSHNLHVPYTVIVSPYNKRKEIELSLSELEHLGRPFIIKPASTTGGGTGVVLGAETLKDVLETRQHHKNDKYLLQETIRPTIISGKRAWFRVFYAFGEVIPCWWDDTTRIYAELTYDEELQFNLRDLRRIMLTVQDICKLDFFSSEIALTVDKIFVVVDYVNEICDMRLQSKHVDGVPEPVVHKIQKLIAEEVHTYFDSLRMRISL